MIKNDKLSDLLIYYYIIIFKYYINIKRYNISSNLATKLTK